MLVSFEDYTRREVVLGEYGGQLASFEWVFSPRGAGGLPVPMFDRTTGAVDSDVIAYWKEHYDVASASAVTGRSSGVISTARST